MLTIDSNNGNPTYPTRVFINCYKTVYPKFSSNLEYLDADTQRLTYYFLTNGSSGIMSYWLKTGMQESPETIAHFLSDITTSIMKHGVH